MSEKWFKHMLALATEISGLRKYLFTPWTDFVVAYVVWSTTLENLDNKISTSHEA